MKDATLRDAQDPAAASVFVHFGPGARSNRDDIVYDFAAAPLLSRIAAMAKAYNAEVDRYERSGEGKHLDDFLDPLKVRWSSTLKSHLQRGVHVAVNPAIVREALWRPFTKLHLYFDPVLNDRLGIMRRALPNVGSEKQNIVICCTSHARVPFLAQAANRILHEAPGGRAGTCFPFYVYDEDGSNRRENITDWALDQFRSHYHDPVLSKWSIFDYVYGVLHHPGYREKFADDLRRGLPRIPFAPDFRAFQQAGQALIRLHLDYETLEPWKLEFQEAPGVPPSYRVEDKMRLSKDKARLMVNPSLTLAGIPPEAFQYRLGNRSALEWVIDQYQVRTDRRGGTTSDPNREEDPRYIVRLVGQVIRVSVETVKIVKSLPAEFA